MNVARKEGRKGEGQEGTLTRSQQLGLLILLVVFALYVAYDLIRAR